MTPPHVRWISKTAPQSLICRQRSCDFYSNEQQQRQFQDLFTKKILRPAAGEKIEKNQFKESTKRRQATRRDRVDKMGQRELIVQQLVVLWTKGFEILDPELPPLNLRLEIPNQN